MGNIEKEIWKDVVGYEGIYEVSNFGMIKRLSRKVKCNKNASRILPEIILKNSLDSDGYFTVILTKNNSYKNYFIHRLVAISFIKNPENKPQVNHKDGIKSNVFLDNLEWCTLTENRIHAYKTGLQKGPIGIKQKTAKLNDEKVLEIRELGKLKSQKFIADLYGVNFRTISNVLLRKTWKHI